MLCCGSLPSPPSNAVVPWETALEDGSLQAAAARSAKQAFRKPHQRFRVTHPENDLAESAGRSNRTVRYRIGRQRPSAGSGRGRGVLSASQPAHLPLHPLARRPAGRRRYLPGVLRKADEAGLPGAAALAARHLAAGVSFQGGAQLRDRLPSRPAPARTGRGRHGRARAVRRRPKPKPSARRAISRSCGTSASAPGRSSSPGTAS